MQLTRSLLPAGRIYGPVVYYAADRAGGSGRKGVGLVSTGGRAATNREVLRFESPVQKVNEADLRRYSRSKLIFEGPLTKELLWQKSGGDDPFPDDFLGFVTPVRSLNYLIYEFIYNAIYYSSGEPFVKIENCSGRMPTDILRTSVSQPSSTGTSWKKLKTSHERFITDGADYLIDVEKRRTERLITGGGSFLARFGVLMKRGYPLLAIYSRDAEHPCPIDSNLFIGWPANIQDNI